MRGLLMTADRDRFSAIEEVHLQTNGLLCDAESFRALRPGSDSIRRINVSIDAGTAEVYRVVRGGDWGKLMNNLRWIGEQRRSGRIRRFTITFTVRRANFRTMPDFVRLGRRFGVDRVQFTAFVAHARMAIPDPAAETVFSPAHPDYPEFAEIFSKLRRDPLVLMRIPAPSRFGGSPRTESRLAPVAVSSQSAFFPEGR
jgi:sulfatase maturation enzyme AslB (radical SAM superfamily)